MSTTITRPAPQKIAWAPLIWIGALHVGALLAFVPSYFTWQALGVCVFLHWVTGGIGITMTYHRLLTHRSFATRPKALEYVMTAIGCCASEGGPIGWVADHRRHHAHSDEEDDVHSPNRGFGWAHMFWWMTPDITSIHTPEYYKRWAPDLYKDPILRTLDKYFIVFPILSAVALYAIGGMPWLVWGFFVRSILVLHTTWLVNSATHIWGYRSYQTRDHSTNLWWVALVTYGEGWHNNHHAFQTSARHGLRWWEVDMTYMAIRFLSFFGITYAIKMPKIPKANSGTPLVLDEEPPSDPEMSTVSGTASDEPELAVASK
ncbi:fatty acid desaturase [Singulisphaera sp. Ch08]|uniref:Fatty acid desaturase n=1 Tax=Singulisphaera sp. Ch08 TaxID=3120278 RepID=A0AAU7CBV9_9BACT